jgi:hypothetical protein
MKTKIFLRPDGAVEGLYSDLIPLQELGQLNVKRATHVEFDNDSQKWVVSLPSGEELYSADSREKALEWEKAYCEKKLIAGHRV